jgi:hypothetical protein
MTKFAITLSLSLGLAITMIAPAQASLYRSANGNTELRIAERNVKIDNHPGSYTTIVNGQTWIGSFMAMGEGTPGTYLYNASFEDSLVGKPNIKCTGRITMRRQPSGRTNAFTMEVTWNVMGGNRCPSIGQNFQMTLSEVLPKPNSKGDYTTSWGRWQVASSDGKLNCRAKANGKVIHTFQAGDEIFLDGRLGDTMNQVNGDSWMYVPHLSYPYTDANYKPCYVRANRQYIQPLPIAF